MLLATPLLWLLALAAAAALVYTRKHGKNTLIDPRSCVNTSYFRHSGLRQYTLADAILADCTPAEFLVLLLQDHNVFVSSISPVGMSQLFEDEQLGNFLHVLSPQQQMLVRDKLSYLSIYDKHDLDRVPKALHPYLPMMRKRREHRPVVWSPAITKVPTLETRVKPKRSGVMFVAPRLETRIPSADAKPLKSILKKRLPSLL